MLFHLARHHHEWRKLREEVLPTQYEPLTWDVLKLYKYLDYTIRETLRLTPIVTINRRLCTKTTILPVGGGKDGASPLLIQAGDEVEVNYRVMMRRKDLWGSNAEQFVPERWRTARPTWQFTPFGGGPRICPAQMLVFVEAAYTAVRLLRTFERLENRDDVYEWQEQMRMTFESKNGTKVGLIRSK